MLSHHQGSYHDGHCVLTALISGMDDRSYVLTATLPFYPKIRQVGRHHRRPFERRQGRLQSRHLGSGDRHRAAAATRRRRLVQNIWPRAEECGRSRLRVGGMDSKDLHFHDVEGCRTDCRPFQHSRCVFACKRAQPPPSLLSRQMHEHRSIFAIFSILLLTHACCCPFASSAQSPTRAF